MLRRPASRDERKAGNRENGFPAMPRDVTRANHVDKASARDYTACDPITAPRFLGLCPILVGKIRVSP
ncbi:MAG: hypothetical protein OXF56_19940 [Rhodobacteraceae bacterium]|nr:hypothetical protein [Paracoccaceae bacterium]